MSKLVAGGIYGYMVLGPSLSCLRKRGAFSSFERGGLASCFISNLFSSKTLIQHLAYASQSTNKQICLNRCLNMWFSKATANCIILYDDILNQGFAEKLKAAHHILLSTMVLCVHLLGAILKWPWWGLLGLFQAVPTALRFGLQADGAEVEPLNGTILVVTPVDTVA